MRVKKTKLFSLEPIKHMRKVRGLCELAEPKQWENPGGCNHGFIVAAKSRKQARWLAGARAGSEGSEAWRDAGLTSCVRIKLRDFTPSVMSQDYYGA